uniref:Uncharacterized protein n=1 Tax=Glossina morsitans morsitans TaxID=37546 RepID=A0A1B0G1W2_GLOMM
MAQRRETTHTTTACAQYWKQ